VPLPDDLRVGVESLSGFALDDVRVHYNSAEPSQIDALAYTQGTTIHVAPGQEQHLPHEAWHVVQQAQGRVAPSSTHPRGARLNDQSSLEQEAETMGARAARISPGTLASGLRPLPGGDRVVQRMKQKDGKTLIKTLAELNAYLKSFNKGLELIPERDFDEEPTTSALNAAIAASTMTVGTSTTIAGIVADLKPHLAAGKIPKAAKDPLTVRKEAAKKCRTWPADKGSYYGGPSNALHVHDVGGGFHVKVGADDRKNVYADGKLRKDALKEARDAIRGHPLADTLNAAIDKALIVYGLELDTY
jgi:hypothetical protein